MSFGSMLYTFLIKPLELVFEFIFSFAYLNLQNAGMAIIALSLAINFLVLPLYRRADAMQEEEKETEAKLNKWVTHIKKAFKGDERTMMLQTYYRQNNYSPTYVLKGAISLFLEIPFFMAAYNFLSELELLSGVRFGPIADLSRPDCLFSISGFGINVLPILMTVINIISAAIFTKDSPLKTKIQLYAMAAFFLVFLYDSPSGLVFYWTLNNVFSLVKTIFYKLKNPKLVLSVLGALTGVGTFVCAGYFITKGSAKKAVFMVILGILLVLPLVFIIIGKKRPIKVSLSEREPSKKTFLLGAFFLAALTGLVIPSALIKANPLEFVDTSVFVHPVWYIVSSILLALGFFVLWCGVFYWLASKKAKPFFELGVWAMSGIGLVNYLFFGRNLGNISADLVFDNGIVFSKKEMLINIVAVLAVLALFVFVFMKWKKFASSVIGVALIAFVLMSGINVFSINKTVDQLDLEKTIVSNSHTPTFKLSKTGKNVVVVMLDRAMGEYVPYVFNERPDLKKKFAGFTYYSNVISFGTSTNTASPALFGGYEYTPVELNRRKNEWLGDKQDESLKVLPVMFDREDYDVTVFDPTYAGGYNWIPDLSIYDDYEGITAFNSAGHFTNIANKETSIACRKRNFFCFGVMKIMPVVLQSSVYDFGRYRLIADSDYWSAQTILSASVAEGMNTSFNNAYDVLKALPEITQISDSDKGAFFLMTNNSTHEVTLLSEPEYEPKAKIDNTKFDAENKWRFTIGEKSVVVEDEYQMRHYQTLMGSFIQLSKWFDHLRKEGLYDNTKIILVSDHGRGVASVEDLMMTDIIYSPYDLEFYFPLLMVKDFGATEFTENTEFMTNADVPTIAIDEMLQNKTNPFTGKEINNSEKFAHPQYINGSLEWNAEINNGNQFLPDTWFSVKNSIWDKANWSVVAENAVLEDYK